MSVFEPSIVSPVIAVILDFFFFQAEDGIRDLTVTGVQTCALPISLLDLKAARLLPSGEVHDEEDLALLEVRDLLFARLLQYRAYKHVAVMFAELEAAALRSYPRSVALEDQYEDLLPEVMLGVDAESFAQIAASVFTPRP